MGAGKLPLKHVVPRDWEGQTVAVLAPGPSLKEQNLDLISDLKTIALNRAAYIYPNADLLIADGVWVRDDLEDFEFYKGPLILTNKTFAPRIDKRMRLISHYRYRLLSTRQDTLAGRHSSAALAINYAFLAGASRILLIGVDCFEGDRPAGVREKGRLFLEEQSSQLKCRDIEIVNCSPDSRLKAYPKMTLEDALAN